ncbi:MAG: DUF6249 domain-containing protein [Pseudomonadota bacterium]
MAEEIIPIVMFLCLFGGVAIWLYFRARTRLSEQETLRRAIDQGQQLTDSMVEALTSYKPLPDRDLRRGLILLALAISLGAFGFLIPDAEEAAQVFVALAVFPLLLSFAYLLMHKMGLGRE